MITTGDILKILGVYIFIFVFVLVALGLTHQVMDSMESEGYGLLGAIAAALVWLMMIVHIPGLREHVDEWIEWFAKRHIQKQAKREPIYGDPDDTRYLTGDDRPLPPVLRYRVAVYVGRRTKEDAMALDREVNEATSFNAFVRREIEAGRM